MITTIIFDLSEVYLNGLLGVENKLETLLKIPSEEIYKGLTIKELTDFFEGRISEKEYWKNVIKKNNWNIKIKSLKKIVRENFKEIEHTREIIEKLKEKGFKLGLLSVHSREWIEYCEKKFDFHRLFNSILYSFEVSICKPDERAYHLILKKLKAKPEECLFIDDSRKNIEAAKHIGISTIHFKNPEQLKKELTSFSINLD